MVSNHKKTMKPLFLDLRRSTRRHLHLWILGIPIGITLWLAMCNLGGESGSKFSFQLKSKSRPKVAFDSERVIDCERIKFLGKGDHGWYICSPTERYFVSNVVYSIGVGSDITWDEDMIKVYSTQQHGWDPTLPPVNYFRRNPIPKGFYFHKFGLGVSDGNVSLKQVKGDRDNLSIESREKDSLNGSTLPYPVLSLRTMMKKMGHTWLSILKIDIEGLEFDIIDKWHRQMYRIPADQVLVELHDRFFPSNPLRTQLISDVILQLGDLGFDLICHRKWEHLFARRAAITHRLRDIKNMEIQT